MMSKLPIQILRLEKVILQMQFREKRLQNCVLQAAILILAHEKGGFAGAAASFAVT